MKKKIVSWLHVGFGWNLGLCFNSKLTISKPLLFIRLQDLR